MKLTKSDFVNNLNSLIPDNSTQQISPLDVRTVIANAADSTVNFLVGETLDTYNFSTPETTSTRAGIQALGKHTLPGYVTSGNSAFGYQALYGNYQGKDNTALGAFTLGCNLYGDYNVGVGYTALAGNVRGSGNIGIGSHTLQSNKDGDFNIAIGHGAGYYIGNNPGSLGVNSYKLYIASVPLTSDEMCDIEAGVGPNPLVYGDLKNLKFGIATKTLHDHGTLQVSGDVSPTQDEKFNLGNSHYRWSSVNDLIHFSGNKIGIGTSAPSGSEGLVTVAGSIVPSEYGVYTLGNSNLAWDGYFNDITVSGLAHIVDLDYVTKEEWIYEAITLHLGASGGATSGGGVFTGNPYGPIRGYLDDAGVEGAGFIVHTSGSDYQRDYKFIYKAPDQSLTCLETDDAFSRGRWYSNISLEVENGRHVKTDRVMADDSLSLVSRSGCYGLFITADHSDSGNRVYISPESYVDAYTYKSDVNLYGNPSGTNFDVSTMALESGVIVSHRLLSRARLSTPRGFGLNYHDDKDDERDRFAIGENLTSNHLARIEPLTIMHNSASGTVGITDFGYLKTGSPALPRTVFHVQTSQECEARFTSLFNSPRIQLTRGIERATGVELSYTHSDIFDISLLRPSGLEGIASGVMSVSTTGIVIGNTQYNYTSRLSTPSTPLVVHHTSANSGTISMKEQAASPTNLAGFGSIFVKPYIQSNQEQSLYFKDDQNNEFNLIQNSNDTYSNLVYIDQNRNTFAGSGSPITRPISTFGNTAYGYLALSGVGSFGNWNTAVGAGAAQRNTTGRYNTAVGYESLSANTIGTYNTVAGFFAGGGSSSRTHSRNVIIGSYAAYDSPNNIQNSIIIGYNAVNSTSIPDSTLLIGTGNRPLVSGSLSSRSLTIDDGSFSVLGNDGAQDQEIKLNNVNGVSYIDIIDHDSSEYVQLGGLNLRFEKSDGVKSTLMHFRHNADPMSYNPSYHANETDRPYTELRGDLRLLGDIKFADGTYLNSSSSIGAAGGHGISMNQRDGVTHIDLDFTDLANTLSVDSSIDEDDTYVVVSVPSGASETQTITKLSIAGLTDLVESGFASVSSNCNMLFTDDDSTINVLKNNSSVFVGCGAGVSATGWRNSIMIGAEAGKNATTPNADIHGAGYTNTASIFIGHRAGRGADNIDNGIYIGTNAGLSAVGASDSVFVGRNAGLDSNFSDSIGIGIDALKGSPSPSTTATGTGNIEIISPSHQGERLFAPNSTYSLSNRINIGNVFAGDMWQKRMSIGQAVLSPSGSSVLEVNHSSWDTPTGHSSLGYIQTWNSNTSNDKNTHAAVSVHKCSGFMEVEPYGGDILRPLFIEGFVKSQISAAPTAVTASSGLIDIYKTTSPGSTLTDTGSDVYIVNSDQNSIIPANVYVVAARVGCEYRAIFVGCSS